MSSSPGSERQPLISLDTARTPDVSPFAFQRQDVDPDTQIHWLEDDEDESVFQPTMSVPRRYGDSVSFLSTLKTMLSRFKSFFRFQRPRNPHGYVRGEEQDILEESREQGSLIPPEEYPDELRTYFGESIIMSFLSCCCVCTFPLSLMAIFFASRIDAMMIQKKPDLARHYAQIAKAILIVSLVITILLYLVFVVVVIILLQPL